MVASSTAGANKIAVLDKILEILKEIEAFSNQVFKGYRSRVESEKSILVHFYQDTLMAEATDEDKHLISLNVLVKMKSNLPGGDPEQEIDDFLDLVGLVEDKVKDSHYMAGTWEDLGIDNITYTFGQTRTFMQYKAMIRLRVECQW